MKSNTFLSHYYTSFRYRYETVSYNNNSDPSYLTLINNVSDNLILELGRPSAKSLKKN